MKSFKLGLLIALLAAGAVSSPFAALADEKGFRSVMSLQQAVPVMGQELSKGLLRGDRVAVVDFQELTGKDIPLCSYWAEALSGELTRLGRLNVVERRMLMQILAEQNIQASDLTKPEFITKAGKILNVKWIITGSITRLGEQVEINARAMNVKKGKVGAASKVRVFTAEVANLMGPEENKQPTAAPVVIVMPTQPAMPAAPFAANSSLDVTVSFVAAIGNRTRDLLVEPASVQSQIVNIQPGTVLHSGDQIKVLFTANRDCYVYIFQFGSTGLASTIFPDPNIAVSNPVRGGGKLYIPPDNQWYYLDNNPGRESLYLVASLQPITDLDRVIYQLRTEIGRASCRERV